MPSMPTRYYLEFADIPRGEYQVLYVDPPWTYRDKALAGHRGAGCKYSLLSDDALAALPVSELAHPDAVLFLWATMPKLPEAFALISSWGFEYKTCAFTWVKRTKLGKPWHWGMGRWTRANAEVCLLATRGKPHRCSAAVHSVIDTSVRTHSQKPDEVRERIVKLMGDVRRIELFARGSEITLAGWDAWGNTPNYPHSPMLDTSTLALPEGLAA